MVLGALKKPSGEHKSNWSSNANLGIGIVLIGGLLLVIMWLLIILIPDEAVSALDNVNIKVFLSTFVLTFVAVFGLIFFRAYYAPRVKVYINTLSSVLFVFCGTAMGFSVVGWPLIEAQIDSDGAVAANFELAKVAVEVVPVLIICLVGILITGTLYVITGWLEAKYGQEL